MCWCRDYPHVIIAILYLCFWAFLIFSASKLEPAHAANASLWLTPSETICGRVTPLAMTQDWQFLMFPYFESSSCFELQICEGHGFDRGFHDPGCSEGFWVLMVQAVHEFDQGVSNFDNSMPWQFWHFKCSHPSFHCTVTESFKYKFTAAARQAVSACSCTVTECWTTQPIFGKGIGMSWAQLRGSIQILHFRSHRRSSIRCWRRM